MDEKEKTNIIVSVICLAYNHIEYIRDALEGFVSQVTDFEYEVIVHDDASDDGTTLIIEEFQKKYPQIIKPIYQKENQYSKKVDLIKEFLAPSAKGKYIALCEGDDYWCNNYKLQKQVDFLEGNPEYSGCGHRHYLLNCISGERIIQNKRQDDHDVNLSTIVEWTGQQFHTSSYLFRKEYFIVPETFTIRGVGNYPLLLWIALNGKLYQFADCMSVYRFLANGSWSKKNTSTNMLNNRKCLIEDSINMLRNALEFTDETGKDTIQRAIIKYEIELTSIEGHFFELVLKYRQELKCFSVKKRILFYICSISPQLCYWIKYKRK